MNKWLQLAREFHVSLSYFLPRKLVGEAQITREVTEGPKGASWHSQSWFIHPNTSHMQPVRALSNLPWINLVIPGKRSEKKLHHYWVLASFLRLIPRFFSYKTLDYQLEVPIRENRQPRKKMLGDGGETPTRYIFSAIKLSFRVLFPLKRHGDIYGTQLACNWMKLSCIWIRIFELERQCSNSFEFNYFS